MAVRTDVQKRRLKLRAQLLGHQDKVKYSREQAAKVRAELKAISPRRRPKA